MSKRLLVMLCLFLLAVFFIFIGCAETEEPAEPEEPEEPAEPEEAMFTPGTYTVTAQGCNKDYDIRVTFSETAIADIVIDYHWESNYFGDYAIQQMKDEILSRQSIDVDIVTGATVTSSAFLRAVVAAVENADGDLAALAIPAEEEPTPEDATTQVVVVGAGGAGLAATVEAHELGMDVILIDQMGHLGGSSVRIGYLQSGGTNAVERYGIDYTVEDWVQERIEATEPGEPTDLWVQEVSERLHYQAHEDINWLEGLGVTYRIEMDRRHFGPVGRLGGYMANTFHRAMEDYGVDFRLNTRADEILMEDGKAVGVKVEAPNGDFYNIYADAVILATGGYNASQEMVEQYNPAFVGMPTDVAVGADGSGMKMAEAVGAELIEMEQGNYHSFCVLWRGVPRSTSAIVDHGAIIVNADGQRFTNESMHYSREASLDVLNQPGNVAYIIMDWNVRDKAIGPSDWFLANHIDMYEHGYTVEELAGKLGIDPEGLANTVEAWTSYVEQGEDPEYGRSTYLWRGDFSSGPYYGAEVVPETHTVHGGVRLDNDNRVLNATDGTPIAGLYAAGEVAATRSLGLGTFNVAIGDGRYVARVALEDMR